jgi:hypothetical protein
MALGLDWAGDKNKAKMAKNGVVSTRNDRLEKK